MTCFINQPNKKFTNFIKFYTKVKLLYSLIYPATSLSLKKKLKINSNKRKLKIHYYF